MRANLSYANLVATLALFTALGGGAYAVTAQKNSVSSKSVKNNSLKGADVADDSLTGADVAESTLSLPAGPKGDKGDPGNPGQSGSPDTELQILNKLKTVDGTGSGLDADKLGGRQSCQTSTPVVVLAGASPVKICEVGTSSLAAECAFDGSNQTVASVSANSTTGPSAQGVGSAAGTSGGGGGSGTSLATDLTIGSGGAGISGVGGAQFYVVSDTGAQLNGLVGSSAESLTTTTGRCVFTAAGTGTP